MAHQQPPEAAQPGEGPLNFPDLFIDFANFHWTPTLRKKEQMRRAALLLALAGALPLAFSGVARPSTPLDKRKERMSSPRKFLEREGPSC